MLRSPWRICEQLKNRHSREAVSELKKYGLQPLYREINETYSGISTMPVPVEQEMTLPVAINGKHDTMVCHVVDFNMHGLVAADMLERLGAKIDVKWN